MKRILIIDDASTVRLYHRNILEAAGYDVDEAINGIANIMVTTMPGTIISPTMDHWPGKYFNNWKIEKIVCK